MTINYIVSHLQAMLLWLRAGYTDIYVQQRIVSKYNLKYCKLQARMKMIK